MAHPPVRSPEPHSDRRLPSFSVTTTVRNEVGTVETALESVTTQIGEKAELVVVDAESDDGTWERLTERSRLDPRIRLYRAPCNRGEGRNLAIGLARSDLLVTHIDGDVRYRPGVISSAVTALAEDPDMAGLLALGRFDSHPGSTKFMVWRRPALTALGGYPPTQVQEDLGLFLRAFRRRVRMRRLMVDRVGDTLDPPSATDAHDSVARRRLRGYFFNVDRMISVGYSHAEYLRLLYLTRKTVPRFLLAAALGTLRYLKRGRPASPPNASRLRDASERPEG